MADRLRELEVLNQWGPYSGEIEGDSCNDCHCSTCGKCHCDVRNVSGSYKKDKEEKTPTKEELKILNQWTFCNDCDCYDGSCEVSGNYKKDKEKPTKEELKVLNQSALLSGELVGINCAKCMDCHCGDCYNPNPDPSRPPTPPSKEKTTSDAK